MPQPTCDPIDAQATAAAEVRFPIDEHSTVATVLAMRAVYAEGYAAALHDTQQTPDRA